MADVEQLASRPAWLDVLVQRATRFDGQPPFSDGSLVALATGERVVLAIGDVAAALVAPGEAEFVVDPDARRHGHGGRMLDALLERVPSGLRVWAHGDHPAARALAASRGLLPVRELLQLRAEVAAAESSGSSRSLSDRIEAPARSTASGLDTAVDGLLDQPASTGSATGETGSATGGATVSAASAGFGPDEWVALNARAFASHPEQGAVTRADLDVLMAEPWFDADDLLLLRDGGELVGYCWLKVEHGIGEFYVVGVSPDRQGRGLGRVLVRAGLARLSARGIRTASLYVEGDNEPALTLYRSFGFADHTIDVQYAAS
jgi:mycothiol synthase